LVEREEKHNMTYACLKYGGCSHDTCP